MNLGPIDVNVQYSYIADLYYLIRSTEFMAYRARVFGANRLNASNQEHDDC